MNVAGVQFTSTQDLAHNRRVVAQRASELSDQGIDLLVFPEASHRAFGASRTTLTGDAEALDGPFVTELCELAQRHDVAITAGMFETSDDPIRPYNTTVVVGPGGLLATYRKIHLYDAFGFEESPAVHPGTTLPSNVVVVDVKGWKIGVMTCFDLRFPELSLRLFDAGAEVIVLGAAWVAGPLKVEQWTQLLGARSIETTSYVVAAAQAGERYCGTSEILAPNGIVLDRADATNDGAVVATLDRELLEDVRRTMPVAAVRRRDWPSP
jgi:deaminated glutathione amidase